MCLGVFYVCGHTVSVKIDQLISCVRARAFACGVACVCPFDVSQNMSYFLGFFPHIHVLLLTQVRRKTDAHHSLTGMAEHIRTTHSPSSSLSEHTSSLTFGALSVLITLTRYYLPLVINPYYEPSIYCPTLSLPRSLTRALHHLSLSSSRFQFKISNGKYLYMGS